MEGSRYIMKKTNILVIDTETGGTIENPIVYDIGFIIADYHNNIKYSFSTVITETFLNKKIMQDCFFSSKVPMYNRDIRNGKRAVMPFKDIKNLIIEMMEKYSVKEVYAYNVPFDIRALENTSYKYLKQDFFPDGLKFSDIWSMVCNTLLSTKKYKKTAINNGWITDKGNIRSGAEFAYRYITKNYDFIESHTALEDVLIEYDILRACRKTKKKMVKNTQNPWMLVNKDKAELMNK